MAHPLSRPLVSRTLACLLSVSGWLSGVPAARAADTLRVDLSSNTGPFHGGAAGTLYGIYDARLPTPNLIAGSGLRSVATKAQDGIQHPGADALEVIRALADASGGDTYIYLPDLYREFPYRWKSSDDCAQAWAHYLDDVARQVELVKALPEHYRRHVVFVPLNEPEGNMFSGGGPSACNGVDWRSDPRALFAAWDQAFARIRTLLPEARIAGPNTSILFDQDRGFLQHVLQTGTIPDVFTWHELGNPAALPASVARFRQWEDALYAGTPLAGRHLPINIDEYAFNYHTSVPGQMLQWVAAIEGAKVDADIAYWNIAGNLSDAAVQANYGNGQWWLLNAYAALRGGHTLAVTPPHPGRNYSLQGLAALDPAQARARVLFGGADGAATIALDNVPAALFGDRVRVTLREIPWTGQIGASGPPRLLADQVLPVSGGRVALAFGRGGLPPLAAESAYELILTPGAHGGPAQVPTLLWQQHYEAEAAHHTGGDYERVGPQGSPAALDRFFTSGRYTVGGFASASDVRLDFDVQVPRSGRYDLRLLGGTFNQDPMAARQGATNVFVAVDGDPASERELLLPPGYKPGVLDHADASVVLAAGAHRISVASTSLDGQRHSRGNAVLDRLTLALPDPVAATGSYEAEFATLEAGARADYTHDDVSGPGAVALPPGATATFWVQADHAGPAPLALDLRGGTVDVQVNGLPLESNAGDAAVFLSGGINRIVVTGRTGAPLLDRLRVGASGPLGPRHEAEQATLGGSAHAEDASLASGGRAVTGIGGEPGNANVLSFEDIDVARAGTYLLTFRYANDEQSPATHYNPDPLARIARLSVNGAAPVLVSFPNSFHRNNWWQLSVPVTLQAGRNTLRIAGQEQPNADGRSYLSQIRPDLLLRSRYAPDLDWIAVTPLQAPLDPAAPTARAAAR